MSLSGSPLMSKKDPQIITWTPESLAAAPLFDCYRHTALPAVDWPAAAGVSVVEQERGRQQRQQPLNQ